jgi:hypothetical protein
LEAVVSWSDGRQTVWRIPEADALLGQYADYRWRKWMEWAASDERGPDLWRRLAEHLAPRLPRRKGAVPRELRVIRYTERLPRYGDPVWQAAVLYRAELSVGRP